MLLLGLLACLNVLSVLDWMFTQNALAYLGASEANPFMRMLFDSNPLDALAVKLVVLGVVSAAIWAMRRYRAIILVGVSGVVVYALLVVYHIAGSAWSV